MGLVASLFSALKAEVEWLITSLAVASGSDTAVSGDTQTADSANTSHRDSAPDSHSAIPTLMDQQADNSTPDHSGVAHANSDDTLNTGSFVPVADIATGHPANLLMTTDFLIDTTDNSGPAPSPGLTPISFESSASDLSSISTPAGASTTNDQDFNVAPPEIDSHIGIAQPHSAAGEFELASLAPQLRGELAHGNGSAGGASHVGTGITYDTLVNGNIHNGLEIVIKFDSSVANAPGGLGGTGVGTFVGDVETVANFFANNFTTVNGTTNPTMITMDVGYGEVAGTHIGGGVLGESETYYQSVPGGYSALQGSVNTNTGFNEAAALEGSVGSQAVNIPSSDPLGTTSQQWWVTTAEAKALGLSATNNSVDGSIGLASGSGTFFYGSAPSGTENDFIGTVAHEMSEVMGRSTLNAGKYFGGHTPEYMPLDLFHFSGASTPTYSGTTAGYFSINNGQTDLENFNIHSSGDFSDWATGSSPTLPVQSFTEDSFDWSGNGGLAPVSYADYLAMEAVGYAGTFSGSASQWPIWG